MDAWKTVFAVFLSIVAADPLWAGLAKLTCRVEDWDTGEPIRGARVVGAFEKRANMWKWEDPIPEPDTCERTSDKNGMCHLWGWSETGRMSATVRERLDGYYRQPFGEGVVFKEKSLFEVWQPDNLVVTIKLQRVMHPIPLFVKEVSLRDEDNGIGEFDGTNKVLKYDILKGEWLPPYGKGTVADMVIKSRLTITDTEPCPHGPEGVKGRLVDFYRVDTIVEFPGAFDGIKKVKPGPMAGIKIRLGEDEGLSHTISQSMGFEKHVGKRPGEWSGSLFDTRDFESSHVFRIRSIFNDNGELVTAYYGKIYRGLNILADNKKGLYSIKFLIYLNPANLDRNLEWNEKQIVNPDSSMRQYKKRWDFTASMALP